MKELPSDDPREIVDAITTNTVNVLMHVIETHRDTTDDA